MPIASLERLRRTAPDFASVTVAEPGRLHADMTIGTSVHRLFLLEIALDGGTLSVRERTSTLPLWCPERHINADGSFCLGLDASIPRDEDAAGRWWIALARFLELQMDADILRTWPPRHAWRHGFAPVYEAAVELALDQMPASFREAVKTGKVRLLDDNGRPVMWVRNNKLIGKVPTLPSRGPGGRPLYRKEREQQNLLLKYLAVALEEMVSEEDLFWTAARHSGSIRCGTMDTCPLGPPTPGQSAETP